MNDKKPNTWSEFRRYKNMTKKAMAQCLTEIAPEFSYFKYASIEAGKRKPTENEVKTLKMAFPEDGNIFDHLVSVMECVSEDSSNKLLIALRKSQGFNKKDMIDLLNANGGHFNHGKYTNIEKGVNAPNAADLVAFKMAFPKEDIDTVFDIVPQKTMTLETFRLNLQLERKEMVEKLNQYEEIFTDRKYAAIENGVRKPLGREMAAFAMVFPEADADAIFFEPKPQNPEESDPGD